MHHVLTAAEVHEPHPSQAHGPPETKSTGGFFVPVEVQLPALPKQVGEET